MENKKCIGCRHDARFVYAQPQCPVHGLETIDWNPTTDTPPSTKLGRAFNIGKINS